MKKSILFIVLAALIALSACAALSANDNIIVKAYKLETREGSDLSRPIITGMPDKAMERRINTELTEHILRAYEAMRKDNPDSKAFETFTTYQHGDILVIIQDGYFENPEAAHGMPYRNYINIGLSSGRFYSLNNLFNKGYEQPLIDITAKHLQSQLGADWLSQSVPLKRANFMVRDESLVLIFSPYDVAAFAAGFVEVNIPLVSIKDLLNASSEFFNEYYVK